MKNKGNITAEVADVTRGISVVLVLKIKTSGSLK